MGLKLQWKVCHFTFVLVLIIMFLAHCLSITVRWINVISVAGVNPDVPVFVRQWDLRSSTRRGSVRCLGFYQGFDNQKICRPRLYIYSLDICTVLTASLASPFWLLHKIELSFRQEFGTKVFTGGWKFVTLMVTDHRQKSKDL